MTTPKFCTFPYAKQKGNLMLFKACLLFKIFTWRIDDWGNCGLFWLLYLHAVPVIISGWCVWCWPQKTTLDLSNISIYNIHLSSSFRGFNLLGRFVTGWRCLLSCRTKYMFSVVWTASGGRNVSIGLSVVWNLGVVSAETTLVLNSN